MSCGSPRKRDRPYDVLLLLSNIDTISDRYQAIRCPTFKTLPSSTHRISITPSLAFFSIVNRYHNIRLVFQFDAWLDDWSYSICMMVTYVDTVCWVLTLSFRICEIEKPHRSNWQCIISSYRLSCGRRFIARTLVCTWYSRVSMHSHECSNMKLILRVPVPNERRHGLLIYIYMNVY